jgi:hypothetical protein
LTAHANGGILTERQEDAQHLVIMPEGFHPFPSRTRKLRPPGPMILGAQAPGKVGHRQVKQKTISNEVVFLASHPTTVPLDLMAKLWEPPDAQ